MSCIPLDFETFYDPKDYTLKKLTTEEYVRDERFATIALGYCSQKEQVLYITKPSNSL
jgi:hypothetical protein